jgi:hypothetical protein
MPHFLAPRAPRCARNMEGLTVATKPADLTAEARAGFDGNANPHLGTSPAWYAHALGAYLHSSGRTAPRDVRMGRGDIIRANDMRFTFKHTTGAGRLEFTRVE